MAAPVYDEVLSAAQRLDPQDQLRLAEQLIALARRQIGPAKRRSIRELRGLGKEIWEGVDAQEYVDKERESWGG